MTVPHLAHLASQQVDDESSPVPRRPLAHIMIAGLVGVPRRLGASDDRAASPPTLVEKVYEYMPGF